MLKNKSFALRGAVTLAHFFLHSRVRPGDRVVDATCGNGRDTLLLAQLVGPHGRVWGFDLQMEALARTAELLEQEGVRERVELLAAGHERLAELVSEPLAAVLFNLGYLPGGDRGLVTRPETTLAALRQAAVLLLRGGVIVVAIYTCHAGAIEEEDAVLCWACNLDPGQFNVWVHRQLNRPPSAPYLVLVEKAA